MANCKYCGKDIPKTIGRGRTKSYCSAEHLALAAAQRPKPALGTCKVDGCNNQANRKAAQMCEMHYGRVRRNGDTATQYERMTEFTNHSGGYLFVKAKGHPRAGDRSRAYAHRVAFSDANGEGPFACHWCAKEVTWANMHVDHLDDNKQNNDPKNLVAACPVCNMQRGHDKVVQTHRDKRGLEFQGEKLTMNEWAERIGVSRQSLVWRLKNGWSVERTLTEGRGITGPRPSE